VGVQVVQSVAKPAKHQAGGGPPWPLCVAAKRFATGGCADDMSSASRGLSRTASVAPEATAHVVGSGVASCSTSLNGRRDRRHSLYCRPRCCRLQKRQMAQVSHLKEAKTYARVQQSLIRRSRRTSPTVAEYQAREEHGPICDGDLPHGCCTTARLCHDERKLGDW
jgi:hypothetical protein